MKKHFIIFAAFLMLVLIACKKEDDKTYGINTYTAVPHGAYSGDDGIEAGKVKLKTTDQFIGVLYSNIFKKGITVSELNEARDAVYSVGDKQLAYEILVVNYLLRPEAKIPTDEFMRAYPDSFLTEVYNTYLVRDISEVERTYLVNYINDNAQEVGALEVIAAVALTNEFRIY